MRVLFATDGSAEAAQAKDLLASLPFTPGSELLILSVVPQREGLVQGPSNDLEEHVWTPPAEFLMAQETSDRAAYDLAKPGLATECLVVPGHPAELICQISEKKNVDLVVVGSRGRSAYTRFAHGSVSHRVAKYAASPVLVVRPRARPIATVLLAVDGSEDSRRAVGFVKRFPLPATAKVTFVHVVDVPTQPFGGIPSYGERAELTDELNKLRAVAESHGRKLLDKMAECLKGTHDAQTLVCAGSPASRLIELVEETKADLLVTGSQGVSAVEGFHMGSVSLQVSLNAPCSVLVVRKRSWER